MSLGVNFGSLETLAISNSFSLFSAVVQDVNPLLLTLAKLPVIFCCFPPTLMDSYSSRNVSKIISSLYK